MTDYTEFRSQDRRDDEEGFFQGIVSVKVGLREHCPLSLRHVRILRNQKPELVQRTKLP